MRIVDYKSGGDETSISSLDAAFSGKYDSKGIFQVLLYSHLYSLIEKLQPGTPIMPAIYKFRTMYTAPDNSFGVYRKGNTKEVKLNPQVKDYHRVMNDSVDDSKIFFDKFIEKLNEIFDPEVPFKQTEDKSHCTFCPFKDLCAD